MPLSDPQGTVSLVPPQAQESVTVRGQRWQSPLWQKAPQEWLPHASLRPQGSRQGGQASPPGQQRRLQACLPQVRDWRHLNSQSSSPSEQSRFFANLPHRHGPSTTMVHRPQSPAWQRRLQTWPLAPQPIGLPQVRPQDGVGWSH